MEEQTRTSEAASTKPDMPSTLHPIWNSTALFNTNVKAVLLYGSKTWRLTKTAIKKLQFFINSCLRNILRIRWPEKTSNTNLWAKTNQIPIDQEIRKRKCKWIGHTLRKSPDNITRQAVEWNPQVKRRVGRPRETCRRCTEREMKATGWMWTQLKRVAQNRVR